ncbi:MAG: uncharacterized protein JWO66_1198 [Candidatus Eremiobacteraeota bacterium]|nr:uncharacterized protein [Candidatus Eremiobacteraeota bacterium]
MTIRPLPLLGLATVLALPLAAHADPLSVFQPAQVRAISVTPADARALRAFPPLEAFGTLRGTRSPGLDEVASASEAAQEAGFALRLPGGVPAGLARDVRYQVTRRARTSFTFDRSKAATWARAHKVALRPVPSGLDGATYTATLEPVAIVTYGAVPANRRAERGARRGTFLAVIQAPVPTVTSNGASLRTLADWFSAQPGVPKNLVAQIDAIGDPTQTLPIPIRFDKQTAMKIEVDGVEGLAIGDETGIGSAVVWTKGGKLYAVGGTFTQSRVLALADSLR